MVSSCQGLLSNQGDSPLGTRRYQISWTRKPQSYQKYQVVQTRRERTSEDQSPEKLGILRGIRVVDVC